MRARRAGPLRLLDIPAALAVAGLILIGIVAVFTATIDPESKTPGSALIDAPSTLVNRQMLFAGVAVISLIAMVIMEYRLLKVYAAILWSSCLFLLLVVMTPLATNAKGSQRWISLGLFNLQPSELAKPILVIALAAYLADRRGNLDLRDVVRCIALTAPYALLVFLQPDFGTMLVLGFILVVMLVIAGIEFRMLAAFSLAAILGVTALFSLGIMRDYQAKRLTAFLDPSADPYAAGYNYRLTRRAVGNGGLTGIGFKSPSEPNFEVVDEATAPGTDRYSLSTELRFVPEQHTDFVFTVIAEQTGFIGALALLFLYWTVFRRGLRTASNSRDPFGVLLCSGIVGYLVFQVFVNIGMTVGITPITGVPLPFVSYGGSSMLTSALSCGILLSVGARRFTATAS